jgi:hypothetical protein
MKITIAFAALAAAVCLAAPAVGDPYDHTGGSDIVPSGGTKIDHSGVDLPPEPEARAEGLRLAGRCDEAIPMFRNLASYGEGFEIAEYNLGLCLFDIAKTAPDAQHAADLKRQGAQAIVKAANAGSAKAQAFLIPAYLDGNGVDRDPLEAGKWALIYHDNGARLVLNMKNISADLQARLDGVLNAAAWAQAQSRADAWTPVSVAGR